MKAYGNAYLLEKEAYGNAYLLGVGMPAPCKWCVWECLLLLRRKRMGMPASFEKEAYGNACSLRVGGAVHSPNLVVCQVFSIAGWLRPLGCLGALPSALPTASLCQGRPGIEVGLAYGNGVMHIGSYLTDEDNRRLNEYASSHPEVDPDTKQAEFPVDGYFM